MLGFYKYFLIFLFMVLPLDFSQINHEWRGWEDLSSLRWGDGFDWSAIEVVQMWWKSDLDMKVIADFGARNYTWPYAVTTRVPVLFLCSSCFFFFCSVCLMPIFFVAVEECHIVSVSLDVENAAGMLISTFTMCCFCYYIESSLVWNGQLVSYHV